MILVRMEKEFKAFNHGKGKIIIGEEVASFEAMPIEIHLKEDGAVDDTPSFAIVMRSRIGTNIIGQISLKMLNEGLADIGYKMVKL